MRRRYCGGRVYVCFRALGLFTGFDLGLAVAAGDVVVGVVGAVGVGAVAGVAVIVVVVAAAAAAAVHGQYECQDLEAKRVACIPRGLNPT